MNQQVFINKKNIGYVNYLVNNSLGLGELNKDDKKTIINILVNNMKYVYSKLNHRKINQKNIDKAVSQFQKITLDKTLKDIQRMLDSDNEQSNNEQSNNEQFDNSNIDQLRMTREMDISGSRDITFMERPTMSTSEKQSGAFNDQFSLPNQPMNNSYTERPVSDYNRSGKIDEKTMEELMKQRRLEVPQQDRPVTPEFIKKNKQESETITNFSQHTNTELLNDTEGNNFELTGVSDMNNLGSLDESFRDSIAPTDVNLDTKMSVEDRLKLLQSQRGELDNQYEDKQSQPRANEFNTLPQPLETSIQPVQPLKNFPKPLETSVRQQVQPLENFPEPLKTSVRQPLGKPPLHNSTSMMQNVKSSDNIQTYINNELGNAVKQLLDSNERFIDTIKNQYKKPQFTKFFLLNN